MRVSPSPLGALALVAICGATVVLPRLAGWLPADRTIELAALALLSILSSFLRVQSSATKDRAIMAPSFIVTVSALLMFGPHVAALVAAAGALAPSFLVSERPYPRAHALIDAAVTVLATAAAGQAYQALTTISTAVTGVWPWQAGLIAAAVLCYAVVQSALVAIVVPFASRRPVNRSWPRAALRGCSGYLVGASVAAGLVALIDQRMWEVLSVAVAALFFLYRIYDDYVSRLEEERHRREVVEFLEHGMSVLDQQGPGHRVERRGRADARVLPRPGTGTFARCRGAGDCPERAAEGHQGLAGRRQVAIARLTSRSVRALRRAFCR